MAAFYLESVRALSQAQVSGKGPTHLGQLFGNPTHLGAIFGVPHIWARGEKWAANTSGRAISEVPHIWAQIPEVPPTKAEMRKAPHMWVRFSER